MFPIHLYHRNPDIKYLSIFIRTMLVVTAIVYLPSTLIILDSVVFLKTIRALRRPPVSIEEALYLSVSSFQATSKKILHTEVKCAIIVIEMLNVEIDFVSNGKISK